MLLATIVVLILFQVFIIAIMYLNQRRLRFLSKHRFLDLDHVVEFLFPVLDLLIIFNNKK